MQKNMKFDLQAPGLQASLSLQVSGSTESQGYVFGYGFDLQVQGVPEPPPLQVLLDSESMPPATQRYH